MFWDSSGTRGPRNCPAHQAGGGVVSSAFSFLLSSPSLQSEAALVMGPWRLLGAGAAYALPCSPAAHAAPRPLWRGVQISAAFSVSRHRSRCPRYFVRMRNGAAYLGVHTPRRRAELSVSPPALSQTDTPSLPPPPSLCTWTRAQPRSPGPCWSPRPSPSSSALLGTRAGHHALIVAGAGGHHWCISGVFGHRGWSMALSSLRIRNSGQAFTALLRTCSPPGPPHPPRLRPVLVTAPGPPGRPSQSRFLPRRRWLPVGIYGGPPGTPRHPALS